MEWCQEGENGAVIRPRWSECHCSQCAPLLMPMRVASDKLYVMSEETYSGKQGELSSVACSASPNPSKSAAGCPSHDVTQGKGNALIPQPLSYLLSPPETRVLRIAFV